MLVLSRKKNESIVIDDRITVTVIDVRGDKVRLGIEADRDIPIHRSEIQAKVVEENARKQTTEAVVTAGNVAVPVPG